MRLSTAGQASASSGFEAAAAFAEALKGAGWSPPDVTFDDSVCEPAVSGVLRVSLRDPFR